MMASYSHQYGVACPSFLDQKYASAGRTDKVILSGAGRREYDGYQSLFDALGDLWFQKDFDPKERGYMYRTKYIKNEEGFQLSVFTGRSDPYYPPFQLVIYPRDTVTIASYKGYLSRLNQRLPHLNVSSVEYANDIYCLSPKTASELFLTLRTHMGVSYQGKVETSSGAMKIGRNIRMSSTFHIGEDMKTYERGSDGKKEQGGGWLREHIDRVRVEYTARRDKLRGADIRTLGDLVRHVNFYAVHLVHGKPLYGFRCFKGSKKLPKVWQGYRAKDGSKMPGSFQAECIRRRKHMQLSQYVKPVEYLQPLEERLVETWHDYDREWKLI